MEKSLKCTAVRDPRAFSTLAAQTLKSSRIGADALNGRNRTEIITLDESEKIGLIMGMESLS